MSTAPPAQSFGWVRPQQPSIGMLDFYVDLDDPPDDDTGLVLAGRYELRRLIGVGATALVYEGVDQKTERPIAVKILNPAATAKVGGFFAQEARIAARVRSPHLIQASDFGEDQERLFIVLDLLPGQPLAALTMTTLMPWSEACSVALHVLDALAALHRAGVVHRDVKPDNIFVSNTVGAALHATLLDLGLAAVLPPQRLPGPPDPARTVFGTAGYIAPEIFGGLAPDPRSDLYSLGAVLYVVFTGQPVPDFRTFPQIVLPSPKVFRPELPDAVAAVVLKALSDIDARFATAEDMAVAIAQALREPEAVAAVPAPVGLRSRPVVGRRTPTRALLVGAAATFGAFALHANWNANTDRNTHVPHVPAPAPVVNREQVPASATVPDLVPAPALAAAISATIASDDSDTPGALPTATEVLEGAGDSLHACAQVAQAAFMIDLVCEPGEGRFEKIDVLGDEATNACVRQVLGALRFEPGAAQHFTQEYSP